MEQSDQSAISLTKSWITHFKTKSDHNKSESLWCFRFIMLGSIVAPILLTLGETTFVSKVLPSICSGIAAFCTAWLQLRKPQVLWTTYRTAERNLESLTIKHKFRVDDFDGLSDEDADKMLASKTVDVISKVNADWVTQISDYNAGTIGKLTSKVSTQDK
ncbi:hypothetical protein BH581_02000 [Vibrio splendidus]|uniref:DUF4231 domain-containing protein n=1 Tax=Vibrio splendidus TaxID=29497 RepID=UPI000977B567|nr:DUF4231 domain-containing protein [Vibrio splendidus]OMO27661.1 hypothetical protein BH581_02000 [Vibrio splendidus]